MTGTHEPTEPPQRGPVGRPRRDGVKVPIRLDPDVRADLDRAVADGEARSITEEINRRCRAFIPT